MERSSYTLVYDDTCPFCSGLAQRMGRHANIKTHPASKLRSFKGFTRTQLLKDVHLIEQVQYDHGNARFVYGCSRSSSSTVHQASIPLESLLLLASKSMLQITILCHEKIA